MASAHRVPGTRTATIGRLATVAVLVVVLLGALAYLGSRMFAGSDRTTRTAKDGPPAAAAAAAQPPLAAPVVVAGPSTPAPPPTSAAPPSATAVARPTGTRTTTTRKATQPAEAAGQREQILALVNTERGKAGCAALTTDGRLRNAADAHSADMAANDYFAHDSQDGTDFSVRITRAGYTWSNVGENIAAGQPTPAAVMQAWMNSSGHRANILNCKFKNLGVGIATRGGTIYWTQDFGTLL